MALFPCTIGGGGTKIVHGTFTLSSSHKEETVNLGFKPKRLVAYGIISASKGMNIVYDEDSSTTTYQRGHCNSTSATSDANIFNPARNIVSSETNGLRAITSTGFTVYTSFAYTTWEYYAEQ